MSSIQNTQYLKVGDCITLFAEQCGGFMSAAGFHRDDVCVQKCSPEELRLMPNMRSMVFKVMPKLVYEATRDYNKEKKGYDQMVADNENAAKNLAVDKEEKNEQQAAQEMELASKNLQVLLTRKVQEEEYNQRINKTRQGEIVIYGAQVQLQHLDSGAYLQISKQPAEQWKDCNKFELSLDPAPSRVIFDILPRYKYRQEGDRVVYGDHILLLNTAKHGYIHYSSEIPLPVEDNTTLPSTFRPNCPYRRVQTGSLFQRFEVNIGSEAKKWQVFPFRQFMDERNNQRMIFAGNVIRLKHAESGGYICLDDEGKIPNTQDPQAYLRIYTGHQIGENSDEQVSTNSMFEVEYDGESENGRALVWVDEKTEKAANYRFRHLNSGRVLSVKSFSKNGKEIMVLTSSQIIGKDQVLSKEKRQVQEKQVDDFNKQMAESELKGTLFTLQSSTIDNDNFINNDSVVKMMSVVNNYFLTSVKKKSGDELEEEDNMGNETQDSAAEDLDLLMEEDALDNLDKSPEEGKIDSKIYTPMNKEEFDFIKAQTLMMRRHHKEEDAFIIKKVDHSEVSDVLFIHSCVDPIKQFLYFIRKKMTESLSVPYFVQVEDLLSSMIFFITETESTDPFTCEGIPFRRRQKYMRECRAIDLVIDMLHYPFTEGPYNFNDLTQRHPITRICQLVYRLLKHCVKDYNYNKFYVAQYIELYFNQAMTATELNNFKAEATITELLKNNEVLLDKQITKETIINFVDLCKGQMKNERFLNLLATLCSCSGEAINSNQDDTCEILLESDENNKALIMKMVASRGSPDYEIILFEPEIEQRTMFINVTNLYEVSLKRDDLRIFNYFKSLINLNAEMCLQRNYRGINPLDQLYPLEQVFACTVNENIHLLLRASFAKFLLHLHIDKDPLENITIPNLARIWPEIVNGQTQLPKSKVPVSAKLMQLKPFVVKFFGELGGVQKAFETDLNSYIVQALGLVEAMVRLGFYVNEDDLIQIIDPLISLLDGSLDIIDIEQLNRKTTNKNMSAIEGGNESRLAATGAPNNSLNSSMTTTHSALKLQIQSHDKKDSEESILRAKRYKLNESNLLLMDTKKEIIHILETILNIQNDVRLTEFLSAFHKDAEEEPLDDKKVAFIKQVTKANKLEEMFKKDVVLNEQRTTVVEKVVSWMNTAYLNKKLDLERIAKSDFVCVLLDLILYENPALVNIAFKLLIRFFEQKKAIIQLAQTVQILEKDSDIAILKSVQQQLTEMKRQADNAEFWLGLQGKNELMKARNFMERFDMMTDLCINKQNSPYDYSDNARLTKSIQKCEVAKLVKKRGRTNKVSSDTEAAVLNDVSEMIADWEDDDTRVIQDDEENDEKNQRLLRNLNAHEIALIIIKQQTLDEAESAGAYLRVLEKAYIFLIKFVKNNRENQALLLDKIEDFVEDADFGVHAFELITEILRNNEKLNTFNLTPIIRKVCQIADDLSIEAPKKATMISFLTGLMICNGLVIKDNQNMILNEITNSNRKNSLHLYTHETGYEQLDLYLEEMRRYYVANVASDSSAEPEIFLPNELSYIIGFLRLLAISGSGRNALTELKCQSFLSIRDIKENMQLASFCYPVKDALLDFLLQIYLDTEKEISEDYHSLLWEVVECIYEDLKKFIEIKINWQKRANDPSKSQKRTILNGGIDPSGTVDLTRNFNVRDCFSSRPMNQILENYIFSMVIPTLTQFFELRLKMNEKYTGIVRNIIRLVVEASKHVGENHTYIRNVNNIYKTFWKIPQLKELTETLKSQSIQLLNEAQSGQLGAVPDDKGGVNRTISKEFCIQAYMKCAADSEEVRNEIELEFQQLIYSIMFIKKKSEIGFHGQNTLETKDILKSLIKLTDSESQIDTSLRRISLKILRKIIEMENKDLTTPAAEWETEDWDKYEFQIVERQNMMVSLGFVKLICRIISNETDIGIKEEAMLAGIALLLGGNEKSQMKFCRYMMKDTENVFVLKFKDNINDCYDLIKRTETKRNVLMQKQYSLSKKIEEMTELIGNPEHVEIKKLEQQLMIVEEEMADLEAQFQSTDEAVMTPPRALSYLQTILRFMQLLCENHNLNLQNQLREQVTMDGNINGKSFDFVSLLARMVGEFYKIFGCQTSDLGQQLIDTLIELIQGPCSGNQKALISAKIIDSSRDFIAGFEKPQEFLPLGFTEEEEDIDKISEFKSKFVTLLLSLLEGDLDVQKINKMANALDFNVVKDRMLAVFTIFVEKLLDQSDIDIGNLNISTVNNRLIKDSFEEQITEAFELYILMQTLAANSDVAKTNMERKRFNAEQWKAYDFIRYHTGKIEIAVEGNLQSVYFPIRPACHYISEQSKKDLMQNVNRESQANKVDDLLAAAPDLIDEMIYNEGLQRSTFAITPERLQLLKDFSTALACLMNVVLFISVERVNHFRDVYYPAWAENVIYYGGIIQGISSGLLIMFYASARGGLITKARWREFVKENSTSMTQFENEDRLDITEMSIEMTHRILMTKGPEASEFEVDDKLQFGNLYTRLEYYSYCFLFFMQDGTFIYFVLYFMISMLAFFYLDIFYALHLLDFIPRSPTLQNVIKSVTLNGRQFAMTGMLLVIIVFIYTTVGFFYLQSYYIDTGLNKYEDFPNESYCNTLCQCFFMMLNAGIRNGGGIGDVLLVQGFGYEEAYFVKLIFEMTFMVICIIIMFNILFGIVIDTFAQLRDKKSFTDLDMKNICYICAIDRSTFDKYSDGFDKHIAQDHNLWQYVFYIVHLQSKDHSDYTGVESYVMEKYDGDDSSWIPLMKAICLQGSKYESSGALERAEQEGEEAG